MRPLRQRFVVGSGIRLWLQNASHMHFVGTGQSRQKAQISIYVIQEEEIHRACPGLAMKSKHSAPGNAVQYGVTQGLGWNSWMNIEWDLARAKTLPEVVDRSQLWRFWLSWLEQLACILARVVTSRDYRKRDATFDVCHVCRGCVAGLAGCCFGRVWRLGVWRRGRSHGPGLWQARVRFRESPEGSGFFAIGAKCSLGRNIETANFNKTCSIFCNHIKHPSVRAGSWTASGSGVVALRTKRLGLDASITCHRFKSDLIGSNRPPPWPSLTILDPWWFWFRLRSDGHAELLWWAPLPCRWSTMTQAQAIAPRTMLRRLLQNCRPIQAPDSGNCLKTSHNPYKTVLSRYIRVAAEDYQRAEHRHWWLCKYLPAPRGHLCECLRHWPHLESRILCLPARGFESAADWLWFHWQACRAASKVWCRHSQYLGSFSLALSYRVIVYSGAVTVPLCAIGTQQSHQQKCRIWCFLDFLSCYPGYPCRLTYG